MKKEELQQVEQRDRFTFFLSFRQQIDMCEEKDRLKLYQAIVDYALFHQDTEFTEPLPKMAWIGMRPFLERGWKQFNNGNKGGAPIGNNNASKDKNNPKTTQNQPKINPKSTRPIQNKDMDKDMDKDKDMNDNKETDAKKDELSLSLSDRKEAFLKELEQYREEYEADMLNDFFEYWTEPNKSQTKMRFEAQKFFKTKSRLNAWKNRKFNK